MDRSEPPAGAAEDEPPLARDRVDDERHQLGVVLLGDGAVGLAGKSVQTIFTSIAGSLTSAS